MQRLIFVVLTLGLCLMFTTCEEEIVDLYSTETIQVNAAKAAELAKKIRSEVAVEVADGLALSLWASDSLVSDPIAISVDENGRIFYTRANRMISSEFDIRSHRNWMTASISWQTVEDRRAFLRETFPETNEEGERFLKDLNKDDTLSWRDLAVEKEQIWFVEDSSGDGVADRAQLYLRDFNEEITDVANGIEVHDGQVFVAAGPDMWRTKDRNNNGVADETTSISHGYAVHIGFSGHGMSGAKMGPDGRIWWGIGDIGMNVVDQDGKRWKYPNQGVIVRSEPDGSGFEVYAAGLRNTHEFVFDKYGNLISEDNDGDHSGERERLVYLINGSDTGWRTNWQFGKYTDPDNNTYKVWMAESLHVPHWEGQAAYILPAIANYVNGPTGMVYNPGTALNDTYAENFFIAEFRGSPANSPIHAFTLEPKGAAFELKTTAKLVSGLLPTGLDFGPDGALYFGDWIDGWGAKNEGRIWKLDVSDGVDTAMRESVKTLIEADFDEKSDDALAELLKHADMRIRRKAQFALVDRGSYQKLLAATKGPHQLGRIHGIWGIGQLARKNAGEYEEALTALLSDSDPEIVTQAAKMLGDVRYRPAAASVIPLLKHESLRVQLHACEALGRMGDPAAFDGIVAMLRANNGKDTWLRQAGMIALGRIGNEAGLAALKTDPSRAVRIAAVVALRRMKSAAIADFLKDEDVLVVTEAARGINDDFSIDAALPELAALLEEPRFTNEALIRRVINANGRAGDAASIERLAAYAADISAPAAMRAEALAVLGTWAKPSVLDRVDGRYRGVVERDASTAQAAVAAILNTLLKDRSQQVVAEAIRTNSRLKAADLDDALMSLLRRNRYPAIRIAALEALQKNGGKTLQDALTIALKDRDEAVRALALNIIPEAGLPEESVVNLLENVLRRGSNPEREAAVWALTELKSDAAIKAMDIALDQLVKERTPREIRLSVIEAVEEQKDPRLMKKLEEYQARRSAKDPLAYWAETLYGGQHWRGKDVFYYNEQAQCVRCHTIFEYGGTAGPGLAGIGSRMDRRELLESLLEPSAVLASGYGISTVKLDGDEVVAGFIMAEDAKTLALKTGKNDIRRIDKNLILERTDAPSAMPSMKDLLSRREIRDLVEYLANLKGNTH